MPGPTDDRAARHPYDVDPADARERYHARWPDAGPDWKAAIDAGHDMDLLEHCLSLTPTERLEQNTRFIAMVELLESARDSWLIEKK